MVSRSLTDGLRSTVGDDPMGPSRYRLIGTTRGEAAPRLLVLMLSVLVLLGASNLRASFASSDLGPRHGADESLTAYVRSAHSPPFP